MQWPREIEIYLWVLPLKEKYVGFWESNKKQIGRHWSTLYSYPDLMLLFNPSTFFKLWKKKQNDSAQEVEVRDKSR